MLGKQRDLSLVPGIEERCFKVTRCHSMRQVRKDSEAMMSRAETNLLSLPWPMICCSIINSDLNSEKITSKTSYISYFHSWSSSKLVSHNLLHSHSHLKSKRSNPEQAVSWATQRLQTMKAHVSHPVQSGTCGSKISQSANCTSTR